MKKLYVSLLIFVFTIVLVACGGESEGSTENEDVNSETETVESTETEATTVVVEHELGTAEIEKNPEKIVVFDFGTLDTLDKLGIDVVGVPQMNIPDYLEKYASADYENVGSLKEPDFEKIAEIDPDLIIISSRQAELYDQLQEIANTVYLAVDPSRYMESFEENTTIIGEIFGKETEVQSALDDIKASIEDLNNTVEGMDKNALIILANDDKISAYGPSSRFGLIHDEFGIPPSDENIEVSTHGMNVSFEYVVEQDPDILYVVDRSAAVGGESSADQIVENKLMERTKAFQNDDIYYLNSDYWYLSGGGLISVEEMIKEIVASVE